MGWSAIELSQMRDHARRRPFGKGGDAEGGGNRADRGEQPAPDATTLGEPCIPPKEPVTLVAGVVPITVPPLVCQEARSWAIDPSLDPSPNRGSAICRS